MPRLCAGKGAGRGAAGRCGAAMCALDPRGQQHTAGEAAGDKRDPESGLFTGRGVSRAAGWEAQKMLQEGSGLGRGPATSPLGTRAHLRLAQGLLCASETYGGSNGAVPQALMTRGWSWQTSVSLVCPGHGACWSTSGSDLFSTIGPLAEQVCPGKHIGRGSVLVVFFASACQGSVHRPHNPHQASPMFLMT